MGRASSAAKRRWNNAHYDTIAFTVPKGDKAKIQAVAKMAGMSATRFIGAAVTEKMNRGFVPPRWEPEPYQEHMEPGVPAPYCGVCGRVLLDEHNDQFRFCPDCGTPVRWETDEEEKK